MKHRLFYTLALIVLVIVAFVASLAEAQTSAPGPYYATPSWDQTLPASTRFIVLTNMNSDAVLDRETGLVWERQPSKYLAWWLDADKHASWFDAFNHCTTLLIGGRHGWRLPMIQELASLVDATKELPALPAGHPFIGDFINNYYWSAYNDAYNIRNAWAVNFAYPGYLFYADKESRFNVWCVRGGQGVNPVPNSGGPLP